MSNTKAEPLKEFTGAEFLFMWVIANIVGLLFGHWLGGQIISALWPAPSISPNTFLSVIITNPIPRVIIVGLTTGTLIGIFQWLVFRLFDCPINWKWAASCILACIVFPTWGEMIYSGQQLQVINFIAILGGVILGVAQWRILRQIVSKAQWWILVNAIIGSVLFGSITSNPYYEPFTLVAGIIMGGITGGVLVFLLKHPLYQSEISF
jgi:hypothetical protein